FAVDVPQRTVGLDVPPSAPGMSGRHGVSPSGVPVHQDDAELLGVRQAGHQVQDVLDVIGARPRPGPGDQNPQRTRHPAGPTGLALMTRVAFLTRPPARTAQGSPLPCAPAWTGPP